MNVFDFAIKMELQGQEFYSTLAQGTNHPGLHTIFTRLAEDEQKHYEIFSALKEGRPVQAMEDSTVLEGARTVFEELIADRSQQPAIKGDLASYRFAMQIESESFRFYEIAAKNEKNAATRQLLLSIAGEEHKHFTVLENIYQFVNAPSQFLAWGEFSNLDEFRNFGRPVDE